MKQEAKSAFQEVLEMLSQLSNEKAIPRNSREIILNTKKKLEDNSEDAEIRVDTAIQMLDEVTSDLNLPSFIRTKIWSIVSLLETV